MAIEKFSPEVSAITDTQTDGIPTKVTDDEISDAEFSGEGALELNLSSDSPKFEEENFDENQQETEVIL